jgi:DNA-binding response OmpR family regulator
VFTRHELLNSLYQHGEIVVDRVIDVHIGKLRQKIGDKPAHPKYILTVRGFGYSFSDEVGS